MTGRSEARKLFAFLGTRVWGYTGKEIADFLGVTNQAVSATDSNFVFKLTIHISSSGEPCMLYKHAFYYPVFRAIPF